MSEKQIPCGDDNKKGKSKGRSNGSYVELRLARGGGCVRVFGPGVAGVAAHELAADLRIEALPEAG